MLTSLRTLRRSARPALRSAAQFHASASRNDEAKSETAADDSVGNDGFFGSLLGNPYTSVPICGLGVMSATATEYVIQSSWTHPLYHPSTAPPPAFSDATMLFCCVLLLVAALVRPRSPWTLPL